MKHYYNEGRKMIGDDFTQGRSPQQLRSSYIGACISIVGGIIVLLIAGLLG